MDAQLPRLSSALANSSASFGSFSDVSSGSRCSIDDPIALPDGRELITLRDAGEYIAALPARRQKTAEWQTAAEMLLMAVEGKGPRMFAEIAMRRALAE